MATIEKIYHDLTNVDIREQQLLWDERGKGYYGEFLVFRELYPNLPGSCKILMNLNIPSIRGRTTEIDLLLIHETGLYVFEMKHYKGTIYGKPHEPRWTQYFRTASNNSFRSPVEQNLYHINNLKKIVPDIPVHSFIVFTSDECTLKVECEEPDITVCTLNSLMLFLRPLTQSAHSLTPEGIDHIFRTLISYSPTSQHSINIEGEPIPFHEFAAKIRSDYHEQAQQLETSYTKQRTHMRLTKISAITTAIAVCIASIVGAFLICRIHQSYCDNQVLQAQNLSEQQISAAQTELRQFAQKFEHVGDYGDGTITMAQDYITTSNLLLTPSTELENAIIFGFTLTCKGETYCTSINRDSSLIIILKDGSVHEYTLPDDYFAYSSSKYRLLGKGNSYLSASTIVEFPAHHIADMNVDDIAYIKLSALEICTLKDSKKNVVISDYEIEIYNHASNEQT